MVKKHVLILLFIILLTGAYTQQSNQMLESYQRIFVNGDIEKKVAILKEASKNGPEMGPLYHQSLLFITDNWTMVYTDPLITDLCLVTVKQINATNYINAAKDMRKLFDFNKINTVRIEILRTYSSIGKGNKEVVTYLNNWLSTQNNLYKTGTAVDSQLVGECINTLSKIGDESSFPVIFNSMTLGYSTLVNEIAKRALDTIQGNYKDMIKSVIVNNFERDKLVALRMAVTNSRLTEAEKAEIAETALSISLNTRAPDAPEQKELDLLRVEAVRAITLRKWSSATGLAIKNFNASIIEYDSGRIPKDILLEAIACLGAMGSTEAASRLDQYLLFINAEVEQRGVYDEQIVLAVIRNLGILGNKVAFDNLLNTKFLKYPDSVRNAAEEAIQSLNFR